MFAHFIITIHNKENLIQLVLEGIRKSTKDFAHTVNLICVFDGCIDRSEQLAGEVFAAFPKNYKLHKLFVDDVHELLSINSGIKYLDSLDTTREDLVFFLQDDVILDDTRVVDSVLMCYQQFPDLGYLSFRCGLATDIDSNGILYEHSFLESEHGHWGQLSLNHFQEVKDMQFAFCEIVIKSPTCIKKRILDLVGCLDEKLAPFGHDDLDLCIRLNLMGFRNAILGVRFVSKLDWGGTRSPVVPGKIDYHKRYDDIVFRNKIYLTKKHQDYYSKKIPGVS
jgi:GT2 family glycosyltransferase